MTETEIHYPNPEPKAGDTWRSTTRRGVTRRIFLRGVWVDGLVLKAYGVYEDTGGEFKTSVETMRLGNRGFVREAEDAIEPERPKREERPRLKKGAVRVYLPKGMQPREVHRMLKRHSPEKTAELMGIHIDVVRGIQRGEVA